MTLAAMTVSKAVRLELRAPFVGVANTPAALRPANTFRE